MPLGELGSPHHQLQGDMIEIHAVTLVNEHLPERIHSVALKGPCRQALEVSIALDVAGGIPEIVGPRAALPHANRKRRCRILGAVLPHDHLQPIQVPLHLYGLPLHVLPVEEGGTIIIRWR